MRFIKFILAFLFAAALLISLIYSARTQVASYILDSYFSEYQIELTCVDFTLTPSLDIVITKACISTPYAAINVENTLLSLSSSFELTKVNLSSLSITGKTPFTEVIQLFSTMQTNGVSSKKDLQHYLSQVTQFNLAIPVSIEKLAYTPFSLNNLKQNSAIQHSTQKAPYHGRIIADKNSFKLSLENSDQINILSAQLTTKSNSFTSQVSTDLAKLQSLLAMHQLQLPKEFANDTSIHGKFNSQLTWQNNELNANSQLEAFVIESKVGIAKSGSFNINGTFVWQSKIKDTQTSLPKAQVKIDEQSEIDVSYDEQALSNYLTQQKVSAELLNIIEANPTDGLIVKPSADITIDFAQQNIEVSQLEVVSKNTETPLQLMLSNSSLSYQVEQKFAVKLDEINYALDSKLIIKALEPLSTEPVSIVSAGIIEQLDTGWKVTLPINATKINLSKLALVKADNEKNQISIDNLVTNLQGSIQIDDSGLTNYSLEHTGQASQFKVEKLAVIEQVKLEANVTGESKEISITADISANNLPISTIKILGNISQPKVDIFANDLLLTDLLGLNLNLPVKVELIDGSLSYHLTGKLTDTENLLSNDSTLSVSIKDMSGDIDNTWIQELNWQQELMFTKGKISSLTANKHNSKNNFTIGKIDTAPSLSKVSAQTSISFQEDKFSLSAMNMSAELLGGTINIDKAQWPFSVKHSVNVQLTSIDLTKLLELDPKQGIIVTGNISGDLPVGYDGKSFIIAGGELHNISNGIIKVADNPTVEQLKLDDPQLKLAFDAMQNLHYHLLTSDVSMDDTGYMLFDTTIKGRNPDIDNDVNLNLNLNYDLMGLLESLNITTQIEQKLIDRLQNN